MATQTFRLKHDDLTCGAQARDNGSDEPSLGTSRNLWPSRPRTIVTRPGSHATAEVAIQAAHAQGLEWVAHFG